MQSSVRIAISMPGTQLVLSTGASPLSLGFSQLLGKVEVHSVNRETKLVTTSSSSENTRSQVSLNGTVPDAPIVYGVPQGEEEGVKENVIFYPSLMEPSRPYPFFFLDRYMLARKNDDNDLEFFYLSDAEGEQT